MNIIWIIAGWKPSKPKWPEQGTEQKPPVHSGFLICLLITLVCLSFVTDMMNGNTSEITYDEFIEMVDKDQVKEVTLQSGVLTVEPKIQKSFYQNVTYRVNRWRAWTP